MTRSILHRIPVLAAALAILAACSESLLPEARLRGSYELVRFDGAPLPVLLGSRVLVVPVAAATAYELLRLAARNPERGAARALLGPGLALQALTTDEPDDDQLDVALVALHAALQPVPVVVGAESAVQVAPAATS